MEPVTARIEAMEALLLFLLRHTADFLIREHADKVTLSPSARIEFDRLVAVAGRKGPK